MVSNVYWLVCSCSMHLTLVDGHLRASRADYLYVALTRTLLNKAKVAGGIWTGTVTVVGDPFEFEIPSTSPEAACCFRLCTYNALCVHESPQPHQAAQGTSERSRSLW